MRLLCTGRGTSGSWQIRGIQLGHAIGAEAIPDCRNPESYDIAVLVKRTTGELVPRLHRGGIPIVYDVLDGWQQPRGNDWNRDQCMEWLKSQVRAIQPVGIVAATRAMADDCKMFGVPVLYLPHHARPGQVRNPIRPLVRTVGYEGGVEYLGRWRPILERACSVRGWKFVVNPLQLADLDIVVAMRESSGYGPRNWKSNVKMANAQGSGTPFIGSPECGYMETASGGEFWVESDSDLSVALDTLESYEARLALSEHLFQAAPTLDRIANEYKSWLNGLL